MVRLQPSICPAEHQLKTQRFLLTAPQMNPRNLPKTSTWRLATAALLDPFRTYEVAKKPTPVVSVKGEAEKAVVVRTTKIPLTYYGGPHSFVLPPESWISMTILYKLLVLKCWAYCLHVFMGCDGPSYTIDWYISQFPIPMQIKLLRMLTLLRNFNMGRNGLYLIDTLIYRHL